MFKNCIDVYYSDAWKRVKIATIPNPYKYRARIAELIDSLNRRYCGYGSFEAILTNYLKKPCGGGCVFGFDRKVI